MSAGVSGCSGGIFPQSITRSESLSSLDSATRHQHALAMRPVIASRTACSARTRIADFRSPPHLAVDHQQGSDPASCVVQDPRSVREKAWSNRVAGVFLGSQNCCRAYPSRRHFCTGWRCVSFSFPKHGHKWRFGFDQSSSKQQTHRIDTESRSRGSLRFHCPSQKLGGRTGQTATDLGSALGVVSIVAIGEIFELAAGNIELLQQFLPRLQTVASHIRQPQGRGLKLKRFLADPRTYSGSNSTPNRAAN